MTAASTTSMGSRAAFTRWLMLGIVCSASAALLTGCLGHLKHPFKHGHSSIGPDYSPLSAPNEYASLDAAAPVTPAEGTLATP